MKAFTDPGKWWIRRDPDTGLWHAHAPVHVINGRPRKTFTFITGAGAIAWVHHEI